MDLRYEHVAFCVNPDLSPTFRESLHGSLHPELSIGVMTRSSGICLRMLLAGIETTSFALLTLITSNKVGRDISLPAALDYT